MTEHTTKIFFFYTILALVLTLLYLSNIIGFIPSAPTSLKILGLTVCFIFCIRKNIRIYWPVFSLLVYIAFNLLCLQPDSVFRPFDRFFSFTILLAIISPLFQNRHFVAFRKECFKFTILICTTLCIASFFAYFMGINMARNEAGDILEYAEYAGAFGGFTKHSMLLAPISGVACCFLLTSYLVKKKIIYFILLLFAIGAVLFAASRSAFAAVICALSVILFINANSKKTFLKWTFIICFLGGVSFPFWSHGLDRLKMEQDNNTELGTFGSRTQKYGSRIREFTQSPIIGIGFSTVDPNGDDLYQRETGTVEPGSSWLAVLSMTGIIGFFFISFLFFDSYKIVAGYGDLFQKSLAAGILTFFLIHMIAEGYIYASGSPLAYILWLAIGYAVDTKYKYSHDF